MGAVVRVRAEKKERINTELARVLREYSNLLYPTLCKDVCFKLPPELRDMVYNNLTNMSQRIQVSVHQEGRPKTGATTLTYSDSSEDCTLNRPWFCDPAIVGDEFAQMALETFYRSSIFEICRPGHLQSFLNTEIWVTTAPKHVVRRIEIDVPAFNYERPAILEETRHEIASLRDIRHGGATIILYIWNPGPFEPEMTLLSAQDDADGEFVKTGREISDEWWTLVHETIDRSERRAIEEAKWLLRMTIQHLLPDLRKAVGSGHTVTLTTEKPTWTYILDGSKLIIDGLMKDWRKSAGSRSQ